MGILGLLQIGLCVAALVRALGGVATGPAELVVAIVVTVLSFRMAIAYQRGPLYYPPAFAPGTPLGLLLVLGFFGSTIGLAGWMLLSWLG